MRKIEALMCDAIRNRKPFKSGNTEVKPVTYGHNDHIQGETNVYLHGNWIAKITYYADRADYVNVNNCGWQSSTTKSRIEYDVKIDPKVTNKRTKKVSANDYEKFAWQVVNDEYLSKFATADVKLNGTGMAIITLKKKEAE